MTFRPGSAGRATSIAASPALRVCSHEHHRVGPRRQVRARRDGERLTGGRPRGSGASPIATPPTTRSRIGALSPAPCVSAARTANPSMSARGNPGTSSVARSGSASTRPAASASGTASRPTAAYGGGEAAPRLARPHEDQPGAHRGS